jgi:hypothetical protein
LPAQGSCVIEVSFQPTTLGARSGELLLSDNATASPQRVLLTGTGRGIPVVSLSTASLTFGLQVVGTSSVVQQVTLKNTGTAALAISGIGSTGDFSVPTKTCGSSLAPQGSCTIGVQFNPTAVGAWVGTLSINDNAAGSPHKVNLSGTATAVTLAPSALSFPATLQGVTSAGQVVTVTNHASGALSLTNIAITGANANDFAKVQTCGTTLSGHTSCTVTVTFRPSVLGSESAVLSIFDNGGASPQAVALSGTGTVVTLSRGSMSFPAQSVGTTSTSQSVTLANHSSSVLVINNVGIIGMNAGDFVIAFDSCPPDLVGNSSCTVSVEFMPTAIGTRTASLAFSDNGGASPQIVRLTGTGK